MTRQQSTATLTCTYVRWQSLAADGGCGHPADSLRTDLDQQAAPDRCVNTCPGLDRQPATDRRTTVCQESRKLAEFDLARVGILHLWTGSSSCSRERG